MAEDARARRELFASVSQLAELEDQLDQMERQLAFQRGRLDTLERDFLTDQRTELLVVLSGFPSGVALPRLALELEDGGVTTLPLAESQQTALRQGGLVEIFHGFVEPRAQVLRVEFGDGATATGYLSLDPIRDRLNLLRLDVSGLSVEGGAAAVRASTWVQASRPLAIGD
jgi:hypothetical protein